MSDDAIGVIMVFVLGGCFGALGMLFAMTAQRQSKAGSDE